MKPRSALTVDISARYLGWAAPDGRYGRVVLPGMKTMGPLYAAVRNALCDLFEAHHPARLVWSPAEFFEHENVWAAHTAVRTIAELAAYDNDIEPATAELRAVRIRVLGRGDFGERHASGIGLVPERGREQAKAAVGAWCMEQGYSRVLSFETGNALVLQRYVQIMDGRNHDERLHRGMASGASGEGAARAAAAG